MQRPQKENNMRFKKFLLEHFPIATHINREPNKDMICTSITAQSEAEAQLKIKNIWWDAVKDDGHSVNFYQNGRVVATWNKSYGVINISN